MEQAGPSILRCCLSEVMVASSAAGDDGHEEEDDAPSWTPEEEEDGEGESAGVTAKGTNGVGEEDDDAAMAERLLGEEADNWLTGIIT